MTTARSLLAARRAPRRKGPAAATLCAAAIALVVALGALGVGSAQARAPEAQEISALETRVADFNAAMAALDMRTLVSMTPPKIHATVASRAGVSKDELIETMVAQMNEVMSQVEITDFGMDVSAAEYGEGSDGTPYAFIPTETVMDLGAEAGGKVVAKSRTLALLDGGAWYLVRVDNAGQAQLLRESYPALKDLEFTTGTMERLTE